MVVLQSKVRQSHFHHGKAAALIMGQVITIYMAWLKGAGNENAHRRLLHQADLAASRLGSKQTWQQADLAAGQHMTLGQGMHAQQMRGWFTVQPGYSQPYQQQERSACGL
jgi:hypothetical protein